MTESVRAPLVTAPSVSPRAIPWWVWVSLFAATLLAYVRVIDAGFIWNDSDYVTAPALRSLDGLRRIWVEIGATEQYYPLLHTAFWFEHRLWGDAAGGYHLLNILLHATSACLLVAILRRLAIHGAILAGFLFALHPVYVESVAWISEQKNTLSLVFYLVAALAYLRFDATRRSRDYGLATVCFVAALLTKSLTATLAPALLVILWWRRGRLDWKHDVLPLAPWFVFGAAMGLVSAWVERVYIGAQGAEFALTFGQRCLLAGRVAWFYVGKLFWPDDLVFIYPRWTIDGTSPAQWLFPLAALALLGALWSGRLRSRAALAAVLFYGGSLFPTMGFFNVYAFLFSYVADHWQYLPSIGIVVLFAATLTRVLRQQPTGIRTGIPIALVTALGVLTFSQAALYANLRTFYGATVARNPDAWMAHNNLGNLLREAGELEAAARHFEAALQRKPDLAKTHNNLANVLRDQRQPAAAETHYRRALALATDYTDALNNLGSLLRAQGRPREALEYLTAALRADPEFHDARNNLGSALRDLGRIEEALAQFQRTVRGAPQMAAARLNLALCLSLVGRMDEAMAEYAEARRLNPAIPELPQR